MSRIFLIVPENKKLEIIKNSKCVIGKYYKGCKLIKYSFNNTNIISVL